MTPPPPLHHGAIGNGRIIGLVSPTSAIEWLCLPRFDGPSVFARLLDRRKGGAFRVLHGDREAEGSLSYVRNTNVLRTVFTDGGCAWEIIDFAPRLDLNFYTTITIIQISRDGSYQGGG